MNLLNYLYRREKIGDCKVVFFCGFCFVKKIKRKMNREVFRKMTPEDYPGYLCSHYQERMGVPLDLENPRRMTEKMQWLKLYDNQPIKTQLADKYLVRDWVASKIGEAYLIPLLGVWDNFDEIDFGALPNQFVLKCNHGSGMNIVVRDKRKFNRKDARLRFNIWMKMNFAYSHLELQYLNIKPKIIAEKYMEDAEGHFYDFKFHCYNGKPRFVAMTTDLTGDKKAVRMAYYDMNWVKQPFYDTYAQDVRDVLPPRNFETMKRLAEKLAEGFALVRVDLYNVDGKIYFGEMTFSDSAGYTRYQPEAYDAILGDMLELPPKYA